jgi:gliding motility-associated lipoprotein GldH
MRAYVIILTLVFFASCGERPFLSESQSIAGQSWNWNAPVVFDVTVDDTVNAYNFFLDLRVTKSYEFSNVYVFFNTRFPDGRTTRDTIEAVLLDEFGNWYGKPTGGLVDNRILFSPRRVFPMAGSYTFSFEQAMRDKELSEVADVGLRIERSKK